MDNNENRFINSKFSFRKLSKTKMVLLALIALFLLATVITNLKNSAAARKEMPVSKSQDQSAQLEANTVTVSAKTIIPETIRSTVKINGAVMYPNTVAFKPGAKLSYYINQAGGYSNSAQKKKVFAVHMNGTVTQVRKAEDIQPGCEILVPAKVKRSNVSTSQWISIGSTTVSLLTVIAAMFINK